MFERFTSDPRGVSELLGSMLLFGLLVAAMVLYQVNAIPSQNQRIEYEHNRRAQSDLLRVDEAIHEVAATGSKRATVVEMGTEYPPRPLFFNPPSPAGQLKTRPGTFAIDNASASGEVGDYWNGSERTFRTNQLVYRPDYNEYENAPVTVISNGMVYNRYDGGRTRRLDTGSPVQGRNINLVALGDSISTSQVAPKSLSVVPVSTETRTITVTNESGPVTLTLATNLSVDRWRNILEPELVGNGGHVVNVSAGATANTIRITLEKGVVYELTIAKVSLDPSPTRTPAHYIVPVERNGSNVPIDESETLSVEVRDRFNALESNVTVTFSAESGTLSDSTVTTAADGRATTTFYPEKRGTVNVTASADFDGSGTIEPRENATFTLQVGGDGRVNPMRTEHFEGGHHIGVVLDRTNISAGGVDIYLNNTQDTSRDIVQVRLTMYYNPQAPPIANATFAGTRLSVAGEFVAIDPSVTLPANSVTKVVLDNLIAVNGAGEDADRKDLVAITLVFDDGTVARYFFQPGGHS